MTATPSRPGAAALLVACTALLAACTTTGSRAVPNGVTLSHAPAQPAPGDAVTLMLRNGSTQELGYNLCTSSLSRLVGTEWEAVPSDRACTLELRLLAPGQEATYSLDLPANLPAGTYRFHTTVDWQAIGTREDVAAEPFPVGG